MSSAKKFVYDLNSVFSVLILTSEHPNQVVECEYADVAQVARGQLRITPSEG